MSLPDELLMHVFKGNRFADHCLTLDVLPELLAYKEIVVETAKEIWRAKNPDKVRLRKNFDDTINLKIRTIVGGSCAAEIINAPQPGQLFALSDELSEAVELVAEAIDCAENNRRLPENFPVNVIPLFRNYGSTLHEDEYIEQQTKRKKVAKYTSYARRELLKQCREAYEDRFDIVGSVTMARVNRPRLSVLYAGGEVETVFEPADEEIILEALKLHEKAQVRIKGKGWFSTTGTLERIIKLESFELLPDERLSAQPSVIPAWKRLASAAKAAPTEQKALLPHDGASNHDKYLYGLK